MAHARRLTTVLAALAMLMLSPAAAQAIVFDLDDLQTVAQGGSTSFQGTLTWDTGDPDPVFLNSINITLDAGPVVDDSPFFANVPVSLSSGESVGPVSFFDVFVSLSVTPGLYHGSATILGGADESAQTELGTQDFDLVVQPGAGTAVPEPTALVLLGTAVVSLAASRRLRH